MGVTDDRADPRIRYGIDEEPVEQAEMYIVLSEAERSKGWVRPYRDAYRHVECSVNPSLVTHMGQALSETYAKNPKFYGATFCVACSKHRPVSEFVWDKDGQVVGS